MYTNTNFHGNKNGNKNRKTDGEKVVRFINSRGFLHFELDCEFVANALNPTVNQVITTQVKPYTGRQNNRALNPVIFTHYPFTLEGCPERHYSNPLVDYLVHEGVWKHSNAKICYTIDYNRFIEDLRGERKDYAKSLDLHIWAYFALADIPKAFMGDELQYLLSLMEGDYEGYGLHLEHKRHLRAYTEKYNNGELTETREGVPTPWYMKLKNEERQINLIIHDISGAFGERVSYAQAGVKTGTDLPDKGLLDNYKTCMDKAIVDEPELFKAYAKGDLHCKEIWKNWGELLSIVGDEVGLEVSDIKPYKTLGATVACFLGQYLGEMADYWVKVGKERRPFLTNPTNWYEDLNCKEATPHHLKGEKHSTKQFLAKVHGGRCHNAKPWLARKKGSIIDIDINGAYGNAIRNGYYSVGHPVILDYPKKRNSNKTDDKNEYLTLREFLNHYGEELIDGLYYLVVSNPDGEELKHSQDLIPSWFPPKKIEDMASDSDTVDSDGVLNLENDGESVILRNEVHLAPLTSHSLDIILNYTSPQQRRELMDKLLIITAIYYPASEEVDSVSEVAKKQKQHRGKNTCHIEKVKGKIRKVSIQEDCHAWARLPLANYIDTIQKKRERYRKHIPEEKPLNTLYKDLRNVAYGVMGSPHFKMGNTVVANNITDSVRSMAWCMEKGLNMFQTITDGGMFDKDAVLKQGRRYPTMENLIEEKGLREANIQYTKLEGENLEEIQKSAYQHLKSLFGKLKIFQNDIFPLEVQTDDTKNHFVADGVSLHGKGDYCLYYPDNPHYKMRGWSDKLIDSEGNYADRRNAFLDNLYNNPKAVNRLEPAFESYILKTKEYKRNPGKFREKIGVIPGDPILKTKQLLECSISQFLFRTYDQKRSWDKVVERLKTDSQGNLKYGQGLEMFYLNQDGSVNYEKALQELYKDVVRGKKKPACMMSKSRHNNRYYQKHPYLERRLQYRDQQNNPDKYV